MVQNILIKLLLAPVSLLYGLGVSLRNLLYETGLLKEVRFDVPVISVGNLSVGGTGKTPHVEYLIRLLNPYIQVATLSRGYRRKTRGFLVAAPGMSAEQLGDEPLQYKRKFPDVLVSVGESRTFAIPKILMDRPGTQVVLLDDAFQHRAVKPGLNILLTEYEHPFFRDFLLPSGRLREWRSAYTRADIIIVTKCPDEITTEEKAFWEKAINPLSHQRIYFSYYRYSHPYYLFNPSYATELQAGWEVLLVCAIANTDYLIRYLEEKVSAVQVMEYEDHHYFSESDLSDIKTAFEKIETKKKIILTTEKDATRLELTQKFLVEHRLPVFVLPVQVAFHFGERGRFDEDIKNYLLNFQV